MLAARIVAAPGLGVPTSGCEFRETRLSPPYSTTSGLMLFQMPSPLREKAEGWLFP